jgi:hypothetical protein
MDSDFKNIFGEVVLKPKKEITLNLYCDEIKNSKSPTTNNKWHFIGILIVPTNLEENLLSDLDKSRFFKEYSAKNDLAKLDNKYFEQNNCKVHFVDLDANMYFVAKRWHKYILHPDSQNKLHFSILGVNESKLDTTLFGGGDFMTIYNRFFRTAIAYPLLKFFPGHKIVVNDIFHEIGDQQVHEIFPWHSIFKINSKEKWPIFFKDKYIKFIDKDHTKNPRANLIQVIDSILGVTRCMFDGVLNANSSNGKFKAKLTEDYSGLIRRLIESPNNPNSSYCPNYCKRMNIGFFPYNNIQPSTNYLNINKRGAEFYKRKGEMSFLNKNQESLFTL